MTFACQHTADGKPVTTLHATEADALEAAADVAKVSRDVCVFELDDEVGE